MSNVNTEADDVDDYMSDDFLKQCIPDVRPGLITGPAARRITVETKQKESDARSRRKPLKQLEDETRQEGLKTSLTSQNKGFTLLQKMGYKPGMTIGKTGREGRSEPIPIKVKIGRDGLGRDTDLKLRQDRKQAASKSRQIQRANKEHELRNNFQQRISGNRAEKEIKKDLYMSQRVCEQLDTDKSSLQEPIEKFYWTKLYQDRFKTEDEEELSEEEETDDEISEEEKLQLLTRYLRETYYYCVWCGTSYDDEKDLSENCPGNTSEDHS
ncbi:G patch domain-containing protein 11-like [Tubulanus polymorphus]|uniref:G patch domain-containing protein 11-like n=1 Tax=Tubulanus polymorphus TaxID=672921 RepID=UPI003DA23A02